MKNKNFKNAFIIADELEINHWLSVIKEKYYEKIPSYKRGVYHQLVNNFTTPPNGFQLQTWKAQFLVFISDFDFEIEVNIKTENPSLIDNNKKENFDNSNKQKILFAYSLPLRNSEARPLSNLNSLEEYNKIAQQNKDYELLNPINIMNHNFLPEITNHSPNILHISGHGDEKGNFYLQQKNSDNGVEVNTNSFFDKMNFIKTECASLKIVILSICYSFHQATVIKGLFDVVIFTKKEVPDVLARIYTEHFYMYLFEGKTPKQAHNYSLMIEPPRGYDGLKEYFDIYTHS
ncbi:MAG: hypothetical protein EAZ44_07160 [Cytophagia bacterium]|nr:MAG: hypothetical protein EAZ44_07160 [Cytophagia bacterium]TAG41788.1 MAG: hypothetical protein EAZ31_07030 [Cytophagia bacterium]